MDACPTFALISMIVLCCSGGSSEICSLVNCMTCITSFAFSCSAINCCWDGDEPELGSMKGWFPPVGPGFNRGSRGSAVSLGSMRPAGGCCRCCVCEDPCPTPASRGSIICWDWILGSARTNRGSTEGVGWAMCRLKGSDPPAAQEPGCCWDWWPWSMGITGLALFGLWRMEEATLGSTIFITTRACNKA